MNTTDKESVIEISPRDPATGSESQSRPNSNGSESAKKNSKSKKVIDFSHFPSLFSDIMPIAPEGENPEPIILSGTIKVSADSSVLPKIEKEKKSKPENIVRKETPKRIPATLDNFIEGISNKLAFNTAKISAMAPGSISPIYIFGPTSVGKTHLLEGITAEIRKKHNHKPALLMTAEQFTTTFIDGLRQGGGVPSFRNKFRGISALLIDDIQFLVGKESTQAEFLRTIDDLIRQGIQIVMTGDRPPRDLNGLRCELIARIESGMSCEICPPERETLLKIFERMVRQRGIVVPPEVCRFVASRLNSHARQLSGALNLLHATQLTNGKPINLEMAERVLDDMIRNCRRDVKLPDIAQAVSETFGITKETLSSNSRSKHVSHPRMLAMWLARKYTRFALAEIGKFFGNRSHSTVVSAEKKVNKWLTENVDINCSDESRSISEALRTIERILNSAG